jgi:hypothetical protein
MVEPLKYTVIICSKCNSLVDFLSGEKSLLYIDKQCKCGSISFYTQVISIKVVITKPNKEPFFEWDRMEFFD